MGIGDESTVREKLTEAERQLKNKEIAIKKRFFGSPDATGKSADSDQNQLETQPDINKALDGLERKLPDPRERPLSQAGREALRKVSDDEIRDLKNISPDKRKEIAQKISELKKEMYIAIFNCRGTLNIEEFKNEIRQKKSLLKLDKLESVKNQLEEDIQTLDACQEELREIKSAQERLLNEPQQTRIGLNSLVDSVMKKEPSPLEQSKKANKKVEELETKISSMLTESQKCVEELKALLREPDPKFEEIREDREDSSSHEDQKRPSTPDTQNIPFGNFSIGIDERLRKSYISGGSSSKQMEIEKIEGDTITLRAKDTSNVKETYDPINDNSRFAHFLTRFQNCNTLQA